MRRCRALLYRGTNLGGTRGQAAPEQLYVVSASVEEAIGEYALAPRKFNHNHYWVSPDGLRCIFADPTGRWKLGRTDEMELGVGDIKSATQPTHRTPEQMVNWLRSGDDAAGEPDWVPDRSVIISSATEAGRSAAVLAGGGLAGQDGWRFAALPAEAASAARRGARDFPNAGAPLASFSPGKQLPPPSKGPAENGGAAQAAAPPAAGADSASTALAQSAAGAPPATLPPAAAVAVQRQQQIARDQVALHGKDFVSAVDLWREAEKKGTLREYWVVTLLCQLAMLALTFYALSELQRYVSSLPLFRKPILDPPFDGPPEKLPRVPLPVPAPAPGENFDPNPRPLRSL
eukprot:TRINITY_DN29377_c0_g1_i1.p1 TRINITY_DN29377_c0_g1~~TRINITY_DN29377_c0_g1_i1.p1  ORF type:complete len:374 (+),score=113.99 TRINITY_DN29377_c0_g1_i1:86-1123(+)